MEIGTGLLDPVHCQIHGAIIIRKSQWNGPWNALSIHKSPIAMMEAGSRGGAQQRVQGVWYMNEGGCWDRNQSTTVRMIRRRLAKAPPITWVWWKKFFSSEHNQRPDPNAQTKSVTCNNLERRRVVLFIWCNNVIHKSILDALHRNVS